MPAWDWMLRLPRRVLCCCLLLGFITAWATPCVAQAALSQQEELRLVDSRIQYLQWLIDKYNTGAYFLFLDVANGTFVRPLPKDDVALTVSILVMTGEIPSTKIQSVIARYTEISDKAFEGVRAELAVLRQERQALATGQPATTTTGQPLGRGCWQLKEGYPKITNNNVSSNAIETLASEVSTSSISYHYTKKKYSGEVEHDCTLSASFPGMDKAVREANEEFTFTLQGSWARGRDNGLFDGKCPYLERDGGVTVVRADPLPAGKRIEEAAQVWVGRFTDGKDFASDRRSITVRMPARGGDCLYGVSIDPNHKVIWAYRWVE